MAENLGAIAIVGMAGRFPGANDVETFWRNLENGVETIHRFAVEELDVPPDPTSPDATDTFVAAKGLVEDVDKFDARFFGYLPKEAALMDPQHRVFLENCYEALEHAGLDPARYDGNVGVYAGCYMDTYLLANLCSDAPFLQQLIRSIQVGTLQCELGNDKDYLATRVAYKLDLRGPAVTLQTACSTSLVAVSHACQGLQTYQCDAALAGGVTITLPLRRGYYYKPGGMLSGDGHCRAFDESAQGTVFSNASAVVVLKRLEDALAAGDTIYATILGHACNNDGAQKLSYTAPSSDGQAEVIALAHAVAGINARTIGYVEAHGTATPLGDPIEIQGLTRAFRATTADTGFCAIGSVKTNVGHLDCASGVVGLIKTALSLHHRKLVPSLHFNRENPNIDFSSSPFFVNTEVRDFPAYEGTRRAGISSFGVGGTNAHLVLEEAPQRAPIVVPARKHQLLLLSAKTDDALEAMAKRLAAHLGAHLEVSLRDAAFTLQVGRVAYEKRRFVVCTDHAEAIQKLQGPPSGVDRAQKDAATSAVVFMFPGQGSQFPGMARELYREEPEFAAHFDECAACVTPFLGQDLRELIFGCEEDEKAANALRQTAVAQPAIFSIEYSLAKLLMSWGVQPAALVGHSVGELAAATLAGVIDLECALEAVTLRGRWMQELAPGAMLSVRAPAAYVEALLGADVSLAAVNAPSLSVVSGRFDAIAALEARLEAEQIPCSRLHTSHAFHSAMMDPAVAPTVEKMKRASLRPPGIPIMSTVTGRWLEDEEATDPDYWGRNLRRTVRFAEAIAALGDAEHRIFLEVGPGQTLSTLAQQTLGKGDGVHCWSCLGHARQRGSDVEAVMTAVGRLWLHGSQLDWRAFHGGECRRIALPSYPFERKRHWVEPGTFNAVPASAAGTTASAVESRSASSKVEEDRASAHTVIQRQMQVIAQQLAILRGET